ncbi:hypothetical protein ACFST9_13280 [Hymenobacter monticola]|uniref:Uncharacterized protein n=1 Tax=Hymenobacter monticola TaxID=1705399 RepID=A0ABY4BBC6_9BACT|nr:hypothetical protein [Hymenobacter monticola]UOE36455.1 hypothetical protein MTP16_23495 [Hymenobacter monticola]
MLTPSANRSAHAPFYCLSPHHYSSKRLAFLPHHSLPISPITPGSHPPAGQPNFAGPVILIGTLHTQKTGSGKKEGHSILGFLALAANSFFWFQRRSAHSYQFWLLGLFGFSTRLVFASHRVPTA